MLIAREKEKKLLKSALEADESQFIAVFGRRRVGKTCLIREALAGSFVFQHTGYANTGTKGQLFAFASSLKECGLQDFDSPSNWLEAFELLKDLVRHSGNERKVVFIDELSWMDSGRSDLMPALEGFWNGWASARKDIVLIVCGSATSWMLSKVVHNRGGLYNRLTAQINLMPFTLAECAEYAASRGIVMNRHQLLECYMVMGGVPYYWSFLRKELSLSQNIDQIFFAEDAPLKDEFRYLFRSLFKRPEGYVAIIEALGTRKAGMDRGELLKATGMTNSGGFTSKLEELEQCGFIRKYREYGKERKNAVYQLIDNFTLFHYKFLEKRPTDERYWSNQENTPARNAWCGIAFERVCLQHINEEGARHLGRAHGCLLVELCRGSRAGDQRGSNRPAHRQEGPGHQPLRDEILHTGVQHHKRSRLKHKAQGERFSLRNRHQKRHPRNIRHPLRPCPQFLRGKRPKRDSRRRLLRVKTEVSVPCSRSNRRYRS